MDTLVMLLDTLNKATPLGIATLLSLILFYQAKNRKAILEVSDNHLSGLPEMVESLKRIEALLQDVKDNTVHIKARLNGRSY